MANYKNLDALKIFTGLSVKSLDDLGVALNLQVDLAKLPPAKRKKVLDLLEELEIKSSLAVAACGTGCNPPTAPAKKRAPAPLKDLPPPPAKKDKKPK